MLMRDEATSRAWWQLDIKILAYVTTLSLACFVLALPVAAQKESANYVIWHAFDLAEIEKLLTEMGLKTETDFDTDGNPFLLSKTDRGYSFLIQRKACKDGSNCLGLDVFSSFQFQPSPAQLSTLNEKYSYMKFYVTSDGNLVLQKYITADYGIARGNVRTNIDTFIDILNGFEGKLNE